MKSMQMKALALAVLGLAGMGSAYAACTNPTPFTAWSSWNPGTSTNVGANFGGSTTATTGLNSTSCAMASKFTASGGSLGETARVFDQSPTKEQTYRFRFYIDPTGVANTNLTSLTTAAIFGAESGSNHGAVKPNNNMVRMYLIGDGTGAVKLRTFAACSSGDNFLANRCRATTGDLTLTAGSQRIEGQIIVGAAGTGKVNIWLGANVGTPDQTINLDNAAWGGVGVEGVETADLGLFQGTGTFQSAELNNVVVFDEFDSRRTTAIGP
jgi:hypothetical protein